jgi:transcriptional regulator with XRE-family HTH domain
MAPMIYPDLHAFFKAEGRIQAQVAHELGISTSLLSMIRWHEREPHLELAMRISERCRVPLASLAKVRRPTPAKAAHRPRAAHAAPAKIHSLHNTNRRSGGLRPGAARQSSHSEKNG